METTYDASTCNGTRLSISHMLARNIGFALGLIAYRWLTPPLAADFQFVADAYNCLQGT
jgi:hypothetical protein